VVNVDNMKAHCDDSDILSLLSQTSEHGFDDSQLLAMFIQQFSGILNVVVVVCSCMIIIHSLHITYIAGSILCSVSRVQSTS